MDIVIKVCNIEIEQEFTRTKQEIEELCESKRYNLVKFKGDFNTLGHYILQDVDVAKYPFVGGVLNSEVSFEYGVDVALHVIVSGVGV